MNEKNTFFYNDIRFWLAMLALVILIWLATQQQAPPGAV